LEVNKMPINWKLKRALVDHFGSQGEAARQINIGESKLSSIIRGHVQPTDYEREALESVLEDLFAETLLDSEAIRTVGK